MTNNKIFYFTFENVYGYVNSLRSRGIPFYNAAVDFGKDLLPYLARLNLW